MATRNTTDLNQLRAEFLATSTQSMPLAGILFWIVAVVASRLLAAPQLALFVGFGSGTLFPIGLLIDRIRGRSKLADPNSPITKMFMQSLVSVVLLWPLVILCGSAAPGLVVLGGAVLMGIVWIPYGWAADDPAGLRHAVVRSIGCYAAYIFVPTPWRLTAVCVVPLLCYGYSMMSMKRPLS